MTQLQEMLKYIKETERETEVRRYVRINVIGRDCKGNFSLVRHLLENNTSDAIGNDGICIVNRMYIRKDDNEWIVNKGRFHKLIQS